LKRFLISLSAIAAKRKRTAFAGAIRPLKEAVEAVLLG
jgi:hypothetical protein